MQRRSSLVIAAVALGGYLAGTASSQIASAVPRRLSAYHNLGILTRVLSLVETGYVEEIDQDRLIYGATRGLVATLDPHSSFMDPEEFRMLRSATTGRFGGIGVEIDMQGTIPTVVAPLDGTPAAVAGVRSGDQILEIDGRPTTGMSVDDVVRAMRGEPGSRVRLKLQRPGVEAKLEIELVRAIIRIESVEARTLERGYGYVRLKAFQERTAEQMTHEIDRLSAGSGGHLRGLVLDLRNNPGGLLDQAVLVSDEFLSDGVIVSTRGQGGVLLDEERAHARGTRENFPIVVLVNEYSASAAEIVAGALQDHGRAVVVGRRTFGKGSVQNIFDLPDGSGLKLTIARYYTPNGRSIQAEGIRPDIEVPDAIASTAPATTPGAAEPMRESDLQQHLQNDSAPSRLEPPPAPIENDIQLQIAYHHLRALVLTEERRARSSQE